MEEKAHLLHKLCVVQMLDFETTSKSNFEVSKSNTNISVRNCFFLENPTLLQRGLFLTMFRTINSSPLLVTRKGFMRIILFDGPMPLKALLLLRIMVSKKVPGAFNVGRTQICPLLYIF